MASATVSICTPTYNPNPVFLREAIESILNQTEGNWTLLIHDDASDVDVRAMIGQFLHDERITFERSERRLGIGGNWNACLGKVQTSFLQYLFQDDVWHPAYLERALGIMEQYPNVAFVSVAHDYIYEGVAPARNAYEDLLRFIRENVRPGPHNGREFLRWWVDRGLHPNVIGEPSFVMIRRSSIERAGPFAEDMPQFLDVEMWIRLLQTGDWHFLAEQLGSFRVHAAAASARNEESGAGVYDRLRCFEKLIAQLQGDDRAAAVRARNTAVHDMAVKFVHRITSGKKMAGKGSGAAKAFALKHPLLTISALGKAVWKKLV